MVDGPIPARQTQQTISRSTRVFTRGRGSEMVATSVVATAPALAQPKATPPALHPIGVDHHTVSVTLPAITAGATYAATITVGLANLTSWNKATIQSIVSGNAPQVSGARFDLTTQNKDVVLFRAWIVSIDRAADTNVGMLSIASQSCVAVANANGNRYNGPSIPTGLQYQSFSAVVVIVFVASANYPGGTVELSVAGDLAVQPG